MRSFIAYQAELIAAGYLEGTPARFGLHDPTELDAGVAAGAACDHCGQDGLSYRPFVRLEPRGYVALAVCPRCSWATAF